MALWDLLPQLLYLCSQKTILYLLAHWRNCQSFLTCLFPLSPRFTHVSSFLTPSIFKDDKSLFFLRPNQILMTPKFFQNPFVSVISPLPWHINHLHWLALFSLPKIILTSLLTLKTTPPLISWSSSCRHYISLLPVKGAVLPKIFLLISFLTFYSYFNPLYPARTPTSLMTSLTSSILTSFMDTRLSYFFFFFLSREPGYSLHSKGCSFIYSFLKVLLLGFLKVTFFPLLTMPF